VKNRFLLVVFAVAAVAAALNAGLHTAARDLSELEFVRCMGFDLGGEGVVITATLTRGEEEQAQDGDMVTATGRSVNDAVEALRISGSKYAFFGHISQYIVGEETAKSGIADLLEAARRDVHSRPNTACYVVQGQTAAEAVEQAARAGLSLSEELEAREKLKGEDAVPVSATVRRITTALERSGSCLVPAISVRDGEVQNRGYAILRGETLAGWLEPELVRTADMMLSGGSEPVLTVALGEGSVSLTAVGVRFSVAPETQNGAVTALHLNLDLDLDVAGVMRITGVDSRREEIEALVEEQVCRDAAAVLRLSREKDADFLDLTSAAAMAAPGCTLKPDTVYTVSVTARVIRAYESTRG